MLDQTIGKPIASPYKGTTHVEDEEEVRYNWLVRLDATPSILLMANQDTVERNRDNASDWPVHKTSSPSILSSFSYTLNPCPNMGIQTT